MQISTTLSLQQSSSSTRISVLRAILLALAITFCTTSLPAQSSLNEYVEFALSNNIVLKQKQVSLEKATYALNEAKGLFLPNAALSASYTTGAGGRYLDFPVGDMLNPVYSTLNQLTNSNAFPTIENIKAQLNPKNYYDAKVRISMPLVNSDIYYNKEIKKELVKISQNELDIYKRELILNVKQAYYSYLMALEVEKIYQQALILVEKNREVNESLQRNGSGLPANVLRSKSEVESVKAQLANARKDIANARSYFNFLLNRQLNDAIAEDISYYKELESLGIKSTNTGIENREELNLAAKAIKIAELQSSMSKSYWLPKVSGFADLGAQADNFKFSSRAPYSLVGIQLEVPLFSGFQNRSKVSSSKASYRNAVLEEQNIRNALMLTAQSSSNTVQSCFSEYKSAAAQLKAAQAYFNLVESGYRNGVNSLIEFLDARNLLTQANVKSAITAFSTLQAIAKLERETSAYQINPNN
jgi:outer membrane protein TolC